ncbi:sialoadhesin-like [Centroberyx affinis]|uniref:sialoadhesin-like n=1 Tax=Centroberyx affinis TaxID=166261 RepID=UPI003A5BAFC7
MLFSMSMCVLFGPSHSEAKPPSVLLNISPSKWLNIGDSVILSCEVTDSSNTDWRFSWYRAILYTSTLELIQNNGIRYSVQQLPDSQRGAGGVYSLSSVNQNHTGAYACRAERGDPATHTRYSYPQLLWVADPSPPASLSISPNRSQHFVDDCVLLSCEVQGNSSGWRLMMLRNDGVLSECSPSIQGPLGPTCNITRIYIYEAGVYWCEFGTREYSNAINVTVAGGDTLLESPVLPLAEGDSLTLRCLVKAGINPDIEVKFYKDGSLIKTEAMNVMTIANILKSDEGMYKCKVPAHSQSPRSWVAVRGSSSGLHTGVIAGLAVAALAFVITISVMVTIFCFKRSKGQNAVACSADVIYTEVRLRNTPKARETSVPQCPSDVVYSEVKKGRRAVESGEVIYTSIVIKDRGSGTYKRREEP